MASKLEKLLRAAESLERGRKNDSFASIELDQIGHFYSRIAQNDQESLHGRLLLAQQGIDSERTEKLISAFKVSKKSRSMMTPFKSKKIEPPNRPQTALEQFEYLRQQDINEKWRKIASKRNPSSHNYFPTDPAVLAKLAERGKVYAKTMRSRQDSFYDAQKLIKSTSLAHQRYCQGANDDPYYLDDFFEALKLLLYFAGTETKLAQQLEDDESANGEFTLKQNMIQQSINFLQWQYLNRYIGQNLLQYLVDENERMLLHQLTDYDYIESLNELAKNQEEYDQRIVDYLKLFEMYFEYCDPVNKNIGWAYIWLSIRTGLYYHLGRELNAKLSRKERETLERIIKLEDPTNSDADKSHKISTKDQYVEEIKKNYIRVNATTEEMKFRQFSFAYLLRQAVSDDPIMENVEGYIFCHLFPLLLNENTVDYSMLDELQQTLRQQQFDDWISPLLSELCLDFDHCGNELLRSNKFPIESVHTLLILHRCGLYTSTYLADIVEEFVRLLPDTFIETSIDYLCFANNKDKVLKYMLGIDVTKYSIDVYSLQSANIPKPDISQIGEDGQSPKDERNKDNSEEEDSDDDNYVNPITMLKEVFEKDPVSIQTLHLLVFIREYNIAVEVLKNLYDDYVSLSINEISKALLLCSILLSKFKDEDEIFDELKEIGTNLASYATLHQDSLTISERTILSKNIQQLICITN